jgi:serine/threonine protein kinase
METIGARYRLVEQIGTGGEARVFRAHDLMMGRDVALRFSAHEGAPGEGREPAVPHGGWVQLFDRGVDPVKGAFTVFELLHGETLGAMLARGPLSHETWLDLARQSLGAVEALHTACWVHGDLNADNLILDAGMTWKLLELPFHQPGMPERRSPMFGSIHTLAPEQLAGHRPDARSDLYALGCLYYKAASGVYPHGAGTAVDAAVSRLRFPTPPLGETVRDFPSRWADWVMRLLTREPADRPIHAGAARQLLELAVTQA